jgi:hypothetical protein
MRVRLRRARLLQTILSGYGLTAWDDGVIPGITVATKTGNHVMTADLRVLGGGGTHRWQGGRSA